MSSRTAGGAPADVQDAFMKLMQAQARLTSDLVESVTGVKLGGLAGTARRRLERGGRGCCDVPPPCWMPRQLGECTSHVAECRTACVDLVVTNCDRVARAVTVQASGANEKVVTIEPATLQLGPFERRTVRACLTVPQGADGRKLEVLLWVRGCREHLLRWVVSVGSTGLDSCHEVRVDDCPDYRHHWYDHFYCARGCTHDRIGATIGEAAGANG